MRIALFWAIGGGLLGSELGSYLGSFYWRLRAHHTLGGRSFCPGCGRTVPWHFNVPIFAFLLLHGRSACCQTPLSQAYLVLEISSAIVGVAIGWFFALIGLVIYTLTVIVGSLVVKLVFDRLSKP